MPSNRVGLTWLAKPALEIQSESDRLTLSRVSAKNHLLLDIIFVDGHRPTGNFPVSRREFPGVPPGISRCPTGNFPVSRREFPGVLPGINRCPTGKLPARRRNVMIRVYNIYIYIEDCLCFCLSLRIRTVFKIQSWNFAGGSRTTRDTNG